MEKNSKNQLPKVMGSIEKTRCYLRWSRITELGTLGHGLASQPRGESFRGNETLDGGSQQGF